MVDRIKKLIAQQNLTSAQFANEIGVQRSALSHLLSGRNKPSLDFMLKIKKRFPGISLDWLLMGSGKMYAQPQKKEMDLQNSPKDLFEEEEKQETGHVSTTQNKAEEPEAFLPMAKSEAMPPYGKRSEKLQQRPEKVILLFSDGTFTTYRSGKA